MVVLIGTDKFIKESLRDFNPSNLLLENKLRIATE